MSSFITDHVWYFDLLAEPKLIYCMENRNTSSSPPPCTKSSCMLLLAPPLFHCMDDTNTSSSPPSSTLVPAGDLALTGLPCYSMLLDAPPRSSWPNDKRSFAAKTALQQFLIACKSVKKKKKTFSELLLPRLLDENRIKKSLFNTNTVFPFESDQMGLETHSLAWNAQ